MRTVIAVLLLCCPLHAGDLEDALQRRVAALERENADYAAAVDALTARLDALESRGVNFAVDVLNRLPPKTTGLSLPLAGDDDPPAPPVPSQVQPATPGPAASPSYQRQCGCANGTRPALCDCLKAGVKCGCPNGPESQWRVSKVIKSNPNQPVASHPSAPPAGEGFEVVQHSDGLYRWRDDRLYQTRYALVEGQVYHSDTNSYQYRDGRMHRVERMAVQLPQRSGYWGRECVNGVCRPVWIER